MGRERPNGEELNRLYLEKGLFAEDIARRYRVSKPAVGKWLDRYEIEKRSRAEIDEMKRSRKQKISKDKKSDGDKPDGYWKKKKNFRKEIKRIIQEIGHFPNSRELFAINSSIVGSAYRYHGGLSNVARDFGYEQVQVGKSRFFVYAGNKRKPAEYYKSFSSVEREIKIIMAENNMDSCPSETELRRLRKGGLVANIHKYHGGFKNLRRRFGQVRLRKDWSDLEFAINQAKIVMEKEDWDELPSSGILKQRGYGGLANAIYKYHSGMKLFRQLVVRGDGNSHSLLEVYIGGEEK